jgi:hypoxanthine phosphoribosyltransferase
MPMTDGARVDVLLSEEAIAVRVKELGRAITRDYAGRKVTLVAVLKGSFVFLADLVRAIDLPVAVEFIAISSYQGTKTTGVVQITSDLTRDVQGEDVLVVEDIVDTGLTMRYLLENLATRRPASLRVCAFLEKPARAQVKIAIDYKGFEIPDEFVVGYGLDCDGRLRNLPYLGILRGEP